MKPSFAFFVLLVALLALAGCSQQGQTRPLQIPPSQVPSAHDAPSTPTVSMPSTDSGEEGNAPLAPIEVKYGSMSIITKPLNANIYLDGTFKGTSPLVIENITYGAHVVSASKPTYLNNSAALNLDIDALRVEINLTDQTVYDMMQARKDQPGSIYFLSKPLNAQLYFEGALMGTTPYTINNLKPGVYSYIMKKTGYKDYEGTAEVKGGQATSIQPSLQAS